jgi:hypothetical protein
MKDSNWFSTYLALGVTALMVICWSLFTFYITPQQKSKKPAVDFFFAMFKLSELSSFLWQFNNTDTMLTNQSEVCPSLTKHHLINVEQGRTGA